MTVSTVTLETTTRVYVHLWGPKAICHDALEPIRGHQWGPKAIRVFLNFSVRLFLHALLYKVKFEEPCSC